MLRRGLLPALLSGLTAGFVAIGMNAIGMVTLTGVAAGLGVIVVMLLYLLATRKPLWDKSVQNEADRQAVARISFWRAVSPWLILTGFAVIVNAPFLPFFNLTFTTWAMPVEVIPGAPEKVRLFWQAYFWILVSVVLSLPFLRTTRAQWNTSVQKWIKRAPRPMLASAVFFAIAYIINHSGKGLDWTLADPQNNMVVVLADASTALFGQAYPLIAPFLGLLGGFVSGSETSSIAMFTALHLSIAEKIGAFGLVIAAASGIGGGLASVISPAKLQNAAASIDRIGEEAGVLRVTFVISLIITAVAAILTLLWA
jgi:lactate permease